MRNTTRRLRPSIDLLPQDLLAEIFAHVAASYPTPISDLKNLRQTCKNFYVVSKRNKIGKSMSVDIDSPMHWWDKEAYFTLLRHCSATGNLDACCILGLEQAYNRGNMKSGFSNLWTAMAGGHGVAAYSLGVLMFSKEETRNLGMQLLNRLATGHASCGNAESSSTEPGRHRIRKCRKEAAKLLGRMSFMKIPRVEPNPLCKNPCRKVIKKGDEWMGEMIESFCSPLCRWTYEFNNFVQIL